jgi:hypothetical protein
MKITLQRKIVQAQKFKDGLNRLSFLPTANTLFMVLTGNLEFFSS